MQTVTIKDFRDNLAQYIEEVAIAKKHIEITKFGKPKALLTPIQANLLKPKKKIRELPGFGTWADRKDIKNSAKWVAKMRKKWSTRYKT